MQKHVHERVLTYQKTKLLTFIKMNFIAKILDIIEFHKKMKKNLKKS